MFARSYKTQLTTAWVRGAPASETGWLGTVAPYSDLLSEKVVTNESNFAPTHVLGPGPQEGFGLSTQQVDKESLSLVWLGECPLVVSWPTVSDQAREQRLRPGPVACLRFEPGSVAWQEGARVGLRFGRVLGKVPTPEQKIRVVPVLG